MPENEQNTSVEPIGVYGMRWMNFMEEQHSNLVKMMQQKQQYLDVARSVDRSAMEYREILDEQYEQMNPRPESYQFEELLKWEQARMFYSDGAVMRERVLIPITTP